jgi:hypothetical protein
MSKSEKKCQYVLKRGKREGEKCDRPSRGDFCKDHNENKKAYSKKYYSKKNQVNARSSHKSRLRKLKKISINKLPSVVSFALRVKKIGEAAQMLIKQTIGVGLVANPEKYEKKLEAIIEKKGEGYDYRKYGRVPDHIYIEYTGKEEHAKKKLEELLKDADRMKKRLAKYNEILAIIEKRHEENK